MVELCGIEPQTSSLPARRSPSWAIAPSGKVFLLLNFLNLINLCGHSSWLSSYKEVIQPQVPLGLPCYDFTPVMNHKVVSVLPERLNYPLLLQPTPMVWRAVCTRPGNVFTVTFWFTITSDSDFMESSCRLQSGLRRTFWDSLTIASLLPSVCAIVARV